MKQVTLGSTGITVPQNGFGALPIQRVTDEQAVRLLRRAYEGGMRFFDTARAYSDSEHKVGLALADVRDSIVLATKTHATTPEAFWRDLAESLRLLKTDCIDIYQFHCVGQVYRPGDGTGMYECMQEAKAQGKIRHIGMTAHKLQLAFDGAASGLYETMQYPLSYLATDRELELVELCRQKNVGFIAMKGIAGGLLTHAAACMAFMTQFNNVVPIWGVQRDHELEEWLAFMDETPELTEELKEVIARDRIALMGDFCRGCGYCMPCPQGIMINQCARMSLMLRRAPSAEWLSEKMQAEMFKIDTCTGCCACTKKCPYELNTPELLKKNLDDYRRVLAGEVSVGV